MNIRFPNWKRKKAQAESSTSSDKPKEANQILDEQIEAGLAEFKRPAKGLFISSLTAGMEVGFSVLFMCTIYSMFYETVSTEALTLYLSLCYPIGFIFVIIGRSELFTEHTALALLPVLRGSVSVVNLLKLWGIVYAGNIIGGYVFGYILSHVGVNVGFIKIEAFTYLAHHLLEYDWDSILLSAILAGWMMGLLGWLVTSSQETISRIVLIIMVTFIIGLAGLHHSIVGSIEVFLGALTSPDISMTDYLHVQFWATLGNLLGGTVFVALLKFSHIRF